MSQRGFTLLEAALVLCLVAAVVAFVLPYRTSEKIVAAEDAAVHLLRRIHRAQQAFLDRSGGTSFAFLPELLGDTLRRGRPPVDPPLLRGTRLKVESTGVAGNDSYAFVVYLARPGVAATCEPEATSVPWEAHFWVAYAWPTRYGSTGRSLFVCTPEGEIHRNENSVQTLSGLREIPPANLYLPLTGGDGPLPAPPSWMEDLRWVPVPAP